MKRKFSKMLSIMLVAIMVLSLVQLPASAATPVWRDTSVTVRHREWIAPYGDEVSHFDYHAEDGSNPIAYSLSKETNAATIYPDGILTVNAHLADSDFSAFSVKALSGSDETNTKLIQYQASSPYIHNFDTDPYCLSNGLIYDTESDTSPVVFEHADIETNPVTGNNYLVSSDPSDNYVAFRRHYLRSTADDGMMNNTVLVADVNLSDSEEFKLVTPYYSSSWQYPALLTWNPSAGTVNDYNNSNTVTSVEPGWHRIKVMFSGNMKASGNTNSPYRATYQRYALFFDDELLTPTSQMPGTMNTWASNRARYVIRFEGSDGVDDFKYYGSSTPHAYGVGVDSEPKSGEAVGGTASMHAVDDFSGGEAQYVYSYYVSDTKSSSGTYTKVTSENSSDSLYINNSGKLVINGDFTGRYLKVGARVSSRGGMSPEVMSKEAYEIQANGSEYPGDPEEPDLEPYVIYSAEEQSGDNITQIAGKTAYKWGPFVWGPGSGNDNNKFSFNFTRATEKYKHLVVEMYSAKNNYHPFNIQLYTQQTAGGWYNAPFSINWEGEWKQIKFLVSGGLDGKADFQVRQTPNFKPYETNNIQIHAHLNDSSRFYEDTEVYISKIYFEGEGIDETVANNKGEIILPASNTPDTDYVSMLKEKNPDKNHPRLLATDEKIDFLKGVINSADTTTDSNVSFMKTAYENLKKKADGFVTNYSDSEDKGYKEFERVVKICGLMYLLTDDTSYADVIWKEVNKMINRPSYWTDNNTGLNCAHISNGMALAYDWCYDYLTSNQKLLIRNALMTNAFEPFAIKTRNGAGYMNHRNNVVAADSKGFMTAALAICDEPGYEDFCNEMINIIVENVPKNLEHQFMPDGAFSEGANYWRYTVYSLMFMTDAMLTSIGSDGGIQEMPGLSETGYYPFAMRGSSGSLFNFSDSPKKVSQNLTPVYHYLSDRYNIPALRAYRLDHVNEYLDSETDAYPAIAIEDLLWFNPDIPYNSDWRSLLPKKDFFLDGLAPTISMRSGYNTSVVNGTKADYNLYVAAKAGNAMVGHCQYDAGSFVLDALGVRWIQDVGGEKYSGRALPTYDYYRVRAEGNNCLVFDPAREDVGQTDAKNEYDTRCEIVDAGTSENNAYSVMDLKPSYQEKVESYKRGYALVNDRSQIIIQDEFTTKDNKSSEIYSYFHTSYNSASNKGVKISVNPDGESLTLQYQNTTRKCRVDFITDIPDFEIGVMSAEHHIPLTDVEYDGYDNSEFHKFYFHAENVKSGTITVVFTPFNSSSSSVSLPQIKPIANWGEYLGNDSDTVVINSIDEGKVNITAKWNFNKANKTIILAAYKNDALVGVKSISDQIENKTKDYTVTGFEPGEYDTLKAFIWDDMSSTLRPVCHAKVTQ